MTLVTQAIKNELGAGVNEEKLTEINLQKVKKLVKKFKIPVVKYKKGQFAPNDVVVKTKGGRLETDKKAIDIFDKSGHHLETYDLDSKDVAKAFQHLKKISEEKLTSEQKLREVIRNIVKEVITEGKETGIDVARRIVKNKQHEKGVDMQTANLIMKIYHAYDKNPALQKKLEKLPLKKLAQGVWKFVK